MGGGWTLGSKGGPEVAKLDAKIAVKPGIENLALTLARRGYFAVDVDYLINTLGIHKGLHYLAVRAGTQDPLRPGVIIDQIPVILECNQAMSERLRAPNECRELALLAIREQQAAAQACSPRAIVALIERADALRRPERRRGMAVVISDFLGPINWMRPLRAIASSGELARVMLALKTVLAAVDEIPLLVFDEVDANVGGETANAVGLKMRQIAERRQVLCITHLPQLAGYGDAHFKVEKTIDGERTITHVAALNDKTRVDELAQMLGASGDGAIKSAKEILKNVAEEKKAAASD